MGGGDGGMNEVFKILLVVYDKHVISKLLFVTDLSKTLGHILEVDKHHRREDAHRHFT